MTQEKLNLGSIQIDKKVIAEIIAAAIEEIDGVRLAEKDLRDMMLKVIGQTTFPGISIRFEDNNEVVIEVRVFVRYGIHIPDIARQIQMHIESAVSQTIDINFKEINVNIQGIERGTK